MVKIFSLILRVERKTKLDSKPQSKSTVGLGGHTPRHVLPLVRFSVDLSRPERHIYHNTNLKSDEDLDR